MRIHVVLVTAVSFTNELNEHLPILSGGVIAFFQREVHMTELTCSHSKLE